MNKVTFIEVAEPLTGAITEHAIIDNGDGSFTSMTKAVYDAQVEHLTEIIPSEAKTK